jgi:hypothetical protein
MIDGEKLRGGWLTLDQAVSRGVLRLTEKGTDGSVPIVVAENTSMDEHVFLMAGEVIAGGKQTRAVRQDVVLAPGQRIDLGVFCVERHRWRGDSKFGSATQLVPQSIGKELRRGADQSRIWAEVSRNNRALGAENPTASLELALKSRVVNDKLTQVRGEIVPEMPRGTVGYIFVTRGRAVGAEMFGREDIARAMLPKLVDAYAVDFVLQGDPVATRRERGHHVASEFLDRLQRIGSRRSTTPGSGSGIRTRAGGLLGDGVSLSGVVVHYGVQVEERVIPRPSRIIRIPSQIRD